MSGTLNGVQHCIVTKHDHRFSEPHRRWYTRRDSSLPQRFVLGLSEISTWRVKRSLGGELGPWRKPAIAPLAGVMAVGSPSMISWFSRLCHMMLQLLPRSSHVVVKRHPWVIGSPMCHGRWTPVTHPLNVVSSSSPKFVKPVANHYKLSVSLPSPSLLWTQSTLSRSLLSTRAWIHRISPETVVIATVRHLVVANLSLVRLCPSSSRFSTSLTSRC
jgi:hypothetical protein